MAGGRASRGRLTVAPLAGVIYGLGSVARRSHLPAFTNGFGLATRLAIVGAVDASAPERLVGNIPVQCDPASLPPHDFIDICTPTATHVDLILSAIDAGRHVLCEKPAAVNRGDAGRISAAARARRRVVMACHQHRSNRAWLKVRQWLDAGMIGRWHLAEFAVYRPEADRGVATGAPWRGRRAMSRGGILLDHGTHLVYQLLDVAGMPRSVQAWTGRLRHQDYDVEDTAHLRFEFGDRAATMFLTWAGEHRSNRIRFAGDEGTIEWSNGILRRSGRAGTEELDFRGELSKESHARWFAELFHRFADAVERDEIEAPLDDITRVATVLDLAYQAAASGARVQL